MVEHQDTSCFERLHAVLMYPRTKQLQLLDSLFDMSKDIVPELFSKKLIKSNAHKLTIYSLFKQVEEGDCPADPEIKQTMDPYKYAAWKQQRGKSKI